MIKRGQNWKDLAVCYIYCQLDSFMRDYQMINVTYFSPLIEVKVNHALTFSKKKIIA